MTVNSSANSIILILFAFSYNLSAENSKLSAESGLPGLSLLESLLLATLWKFLKDTLIHPQSAHTLPDKSIRRTHDGHTLNFLMYVCLIVCKCSSSSSKTQHACMNPNMYDCFTMQSLLWPNAPINGGWAVLFTA